MGTYVISIGEVSMFSRKKSLWKSGNEVSFTLYVEIST
jgi:hypothetical protein